MNTLTKTIGSLLLADRLRHSDKDGNPQSRPAQAARLKVTEGALRHFESGRRVPMRALRTSMAKLLGVPAAAFLEQCEAAEVKKANAAGLAIGRANSARAKARKMVKRSVKATRKPKGRNRKVQR